MLDISKNTRYYVNFSVEWRALTRLCNLTGAGRIFWEIFLEIGQRAPAKIFVRSGCVRDVAVYLREMRLDQK